MPSDTYVAPNDDALRWYHSPEEHAVQIIFMNCLLIPICVFLWKRFQKQQSKRSDDELAPLVAPRPLSIIEILSVASLTCAWILQAYHKMQYGPRRLGNFLYPCHPFTACILLSFYVRPYNYRLASYIWTFAVQCSVLSLVAMLLPDTSDIAPAFKWWAIPSYWIHHGVLTMLPWVCTATRAFHVRPDQFNTFWWPFAYALWTLFFFDVQQTVSLFMNTVGRTWGTESEEIMNINYMIYPPPVASKLMIRVGLCLITTVKYCLVTFVVFCHCRGVADETL